MELKSLDFREKRKKSWTRLEKLIERVEKNGIRSLTPDEIAEVGNLYRTTCSSLYVARNISLDQSVHQYLENLVTKSYLAIYTNQSSNELSIYQFFAKSFPKSFRNYFYYHLLSFIFLMMGFIGGYYGTAYDNAYYFAFVDRTLAQERTPYAAKETLEKSLVSGRETDAAERTAFASFLFTHNTKVGILCFCLSVAFGVPTIFLLIMTGGMLGAMSQIFHSHNLAVEWWAWILPHGVTEIFAIIVCGGCGLAVAHSFIMGGPYGRWYAVRQTGRDIGTTMLGTVLLFFIAGLIEGYFRQTSLSNPPRYAFAFLTFAAWFFYFLLVGSNNYEQK